MRLPAWLSSPSVKGVGRLSSGALLAQVIGFALTPIVTRLYTPAEYGTLAIFTATVAILVTVAAGRYDGAIVLPPETAAGSRDALALSRLAALISIVFSVLLLLLLVVLHAVGVHLWLDGLGIWAYAIPLAVLLGALGAILSSFAIRQREYGKIARIAPVSRLVYSGVQIGMGVAGAGTAGLILAALVSPLVGFAVRIRILREAIAQLGEAARGPWKSDMARVARLYSDFPKVNLFFSLINALSWNVQVLIIGYFFSKADVGQYSLAVALLSVPGAFLIGAVSQVFLRELSARAHDVTASLRLAHRTLASLAAVSLVPFLFLGIFAPEIFSLLFGEQWQLAGEIARAMLPLLWARFLSTTLSSTLVVYRKQTQLLIWQIVSLAATVAAFAGGGAMGWSIVECSWAASVIVGPLYLALIPMSLRAIKSGPPPQSTHSDTGVGPVVA